MVTGPDCREDGNMCPKGMHHAARSVSAWRSVGVHSIGTNLTILPSTDLAPPNFYLFSKTEHFAGKRFADDEDLQHAVMDWLNSQAAVWYEEGISKLVSR